MFDLETSNLVVTSVYIVANVAYKIFRGHYMAGKQEAKVECGRGVYKPDVDVIVPSYNENASALIGCISSIKNQLYEGKIRCFVVDDGSSDPRGFVEARRLYQDDSDIEFIELPRNMGKREAQIAAVNMSFGEFILNVDSDTSLAPDVVKHLVRKMIDSRVGGVMGQLVASNRSTNWLTKLIDMEYWIACNEERSAQSRFGTVMCCCGPCAMYRREAFMRVLSEYRSQYFLGKESNFGEDRHITLLMLRSGYRTEYEYMASAATIVPSSMSAYVLQQLRWARSTFRDSFLALKIASSLNAYVVSEVILQTLFIFLTPITMITAIGVAVLDAKVPYYTLITFLLIELWCCAIAAAASKDLRFMFFIAHAPINYLVLGPIKVYAALTVGNSSWMSRNNRLVSADDETMPL
ncbi:glycosyltransferase [Azorhizobium doebereinerae]|uniref:glycosyltransferase n=1 Tax=Azorhizobium doebereinerae TaxID=281091 RepID=UPI0009FC1BD4|nr:glycosyltransferase [Azorhizobium doebereinerae]